MNDFFNIKLFAKRFNLFKLLSPQKSVEIILQNKNLKLRAIFWVHRKNGENFLNVLFPENLCQLCFRQKLCANDLDQIKMQQEQSTKNENKDEKF
jgi:hypothetical protein